MLLIFCVLLGLTFVSPGRCFNEYENENFIIEAPIRNIEKRFDPDWKDLDTRIAPTWYDKAKIGIFLHWGLYCVPGFRSEWFWSYWKGNDSAIINYMAKNYPPGFTYQDFAPLFKAEFFDPNSFAELFHEAGAKYVVLTSKHHEGYTMFPSHRSFSWNSVESGPHRDLVGEIAESVRNKGLKFGVYHSLYEWFNPIYLEDRKNSFETRDYVDTKLIPDLKQLINDYEPSIIWADGDWEATDSYWRSTEFLAWLYNDSPVKDDVLVNDRWGKGLYCSHGDFYNCFDRYNPGKLQKHKWENAFTLDLRSWGHRKNMNANEVMNISRLLTEVVSTVSCGGNALINIGPTKEGTIDPIFQERLLDLGKWLKINGEAIYETSPWESQNDTYNGDVWYTCRKEVHNAIDPTAKPNKADKVIAIYAIFLKWPRNDDNVLTVGDLTDYLRKGNWKAVLLGNEEKSLKWDRKNGKTVIHLPSLDAVKSENAWALKFEQT